MRVEMAMEVRDEMGVQVERLAAAAQALEQLLDREMSFSAAAGSREVELKRKLMEAEATIASLRTAAVPVAGAVVRKTVASGVASLMAKTGVGGEAVEVGALDAALVSLSIEQRIAVKAQMMRSGLVG